MSLELTGVIEKVLPMQSGSGKNGDWSKQEILLSVENGKFTDQVIITDFNGKAQLDKFNVHDKVTVKFNLKSREWKDRYFLEATAWRIEAANQSNDSQQSQSTAPTQQRPTPRPTPAPLPSSFEGEESDLPF